MTPITKWPAERREHAKARTIALGGDVNAAARELGETRSALSTMLSVHFPGWRDELPRWTAPASAGVAVSDAPAWQGYRPMAGWTPPQPSRVARARTEEVTRTVVLADVHAPCHDRAAWACALGVIRELAPQRVVINGDFLDLESLSRHPKARPDLTRLSGEWYAGNVMLDELQDAAGSAEVVYLEGNHESRASRYCLEFGPLDGVLDVAQSLYITPRGEYHREAVKLRGVRWVPLRLQPFDLEGVGYLHGVFECMHHAAAHANGLGPRSGLRTLVTAHMHAWQSFTSNAGYSAFACPWLGDSSQPVFAYTKGRPRPWSQGLLHIEQAGPSTSVSLIPIEHGRALALGHVVAAAA